MARWLAITAYVNNNNSAKALLPTLRALMSGYGNKKDENTLALSLNGNNVQLNDTSMHPESRKVL